MIGSAKDNEGRWDDLIASLRPRHWVKNLLVFTAPVFAEQLTNPVSLAKSTLTFVIFCFLSSGAYLLNDVLDRKHDLHHPLKKGRPIASGRLSPASALVWAAMLTGLGLGLTGFLEKTTFWVALAFVLVGMVYSIWLKHMVIVDAFALAAGFVLRTVSGATAIEVPISAWLLICTMLLSLFLGLTKRSLEIKMLQGEAANHRPSLAQYNPYLLDRMSAVISSAILITYTLYTLSDATVARFGSNGLFATTPVVLYGIFRYLYLVHQKETKSTMEVELISDRPMRLAVGLYAAMVFAVAYL
jgi:4-hydroxybenzoate polyprenyltransferase